MFYFSSDDIEIAGASPETLVKLEQGKLSTFPLAGTRPRGKDKEEDQALEKELCRMKRNWRNTICWWIWAEMTSGKSVKSAQ